MICRQSQQRPRTNAVGVCWRLFKGFQRLILRWFFPALLVPGLEMVATLGFVSQLKVATFFLLPISSIIALILSYSAALSLGFLATEFFILPRSSTAAACAPAPTYTSSFIELHKSIMKSESLTQDGRVWILGGGSQWMDSTNRMLVRDSWTGIASILTKKRNAILRGKAGRGKSLFLLFFMFEILLCAKNGVASNLINDLQPPRDVVIAYVDRSGTKHCVTVTGVKIISDPGWPAHVSYCFSDNRDVTDANVGSLLTLAVASGVEAVLQEFSKRIDGISSGLKADLCMSSLSLQEMALIFSDMGEEERQFKFDVVGGNPRKFTAEAVVVEDEQFHDFVQEVLVWMFGEDYLPSDGATPTTTQRLGSWAVNLLVGTLINAPAVPKTDSSLFKEYIVREDHTVQREQFASTFLSLVAGLLEEKVETNVMPGLKHLVGATGRGCAFEYSSRIVLARTRAEHICWSSSGRYVKMALGDKRNVLIRSIDDIKTLQPGERGIPTICNFLLVGEVIPPDIGVRFTTSHTHTVPATSAQPVIDALGLSTQAKFTVVFVVPREVLPDFVFPSNLGQIRMCVTIPEAVTDEEFKRLRKKRKRSESARAVLTASVA
jgi:hypothetical protein